MGDPRLAAFLADPQSQIAKLVDGQRSEVFGRVSEIIGELATRGISEDEKKSLSQSILGLIAEWYCQKVPTHRKDWLYAEYLSLFMLNGLCWVAQLYTEIDRSHRQTMLASFLGRFEAKALLEEALNAADQQEQVDRIIRLILAVIGYLRSQYGEFEVAGEGMLTEYAMDPKRIRFWPPVVATDEEKNQVLQRVVEAVASLEHGLGLLLVGSYAAEYKRDEFGDLDLCSLCAQKPNAASKVSLVDSIAPENHDTYGEHLYLDFGTTSIHFEFATQEVQERYFKQLREEGTELPYINVSNSEYALSAYGWSTGQILFDPKGMMAVYKESVNPFPAAMKRLQTRYWSTRWRESSAAYLRADKQRDRISALNELHTCWEAAIRLLMVRHEIYSNPHSPKWIPCELANLPPEKQASLKTQLGLLELDVMAPLGTRFEYALKLMAAN